jgi:hypothetical protein
MEEKLNEIDMIYIQNTSGNNYSIECVGRGKQSVKLNYSNVENIEINTPAALGIRHSYIQMAEGQPKMFNIKLEYPQSISIKFMGKIIIEKI